MSNILTSLLYWKSPEQKDFWKNITEFSINSYNGKLQGSWEYEPVIEDGRLPQDTIFFNNFKRLYEWWQEGHNVFYVNVDMICVKPFKVFGEYDHLMMPWYSDPPSKEEFPIYFNCAVLYIPKETKQEIWDYGFEEYKKYFSGPPIQWAADQRIFNLMFYKQQVNPVLDNRLHWLEGASHLNMVPKEEASILHYFTTRGADEAYERMQQDYKIFNQ